MYWLNRLINYRWRSSDVYYILCMYHTQVKFYRTACISYCLISFRLGWIMLDDTPNHINAFVRSIRILFSELFRSVLFFYFFVAFILWICVDRSKLLLFQSCYIGTLVVRMSYYNFELLLCLCFAHPFTWSYETTFSLECFYLSSQRKMSFRVQQLFEFHENWYGIWLGALDSMMLFVYILLNQIYRLKTDIQIFTVWVSNISSDFSL